MRVTKAPRGKMDKADKKDRTRSWLRKAKPVIFAGSLVLAALLVLGGTLAWFTSADEVENRVRREDPAKEFAVVEVDVFDPEPDGSGLYEKRVGAQNVGDIPAFVRLLVLPVFKSAEGHLLPAVLGKPGDPGANVIVTDFNLATWNGSAWTGGDWVDGGDGYYYYLNRLDPVDYYGKGCSTDIDDLNKNLFNHLKLVTPMPEGYENATLLIEVKCEAVEVKNYREAWWLLANNTAPTAPDTIVRIDGRLQGQIE